jgi:lipid A 4'-phosphatase
MGDDRQKSWKTLIFGAYWELRFILGLLALGIVASLLIELNGWDLAISSRFFVPGGAHGGWIFARDQPWRLLYEYGEIPPTLFAAGALWLYRAARTGKARPAYARPCLVVILTMVLGPALLVNGILKNDWGRPRPADIKVFGGSSTFLKVWQPGVPGGGKSFTCGHCSAGFAVASGASFSGMHPILGGIALVGGLVYGVLLGIARIVQGGHFVTDVIWSGVLVLALAAALHFLVFRVPGVIQEPLSVPRPATKSDEEPLFPQQKDPPDAS